MKWNAYWRRYEDRARERPVIFVARDGTAYVAVDWAEVLRQKLLPRQPGKPRRIAKPRLPRVKLPTPTHEAPRRAQ